MEIRVADASMPHRLASATITVADAGGRPRPNTHVQVRQTRHDFLFGNILFDLIPWASGASDDEARDSRLAEDWLGLFNFGTLPFYWRHFEDSPGLPATENMLAVAQRFKDLGVTLKGHPLVWHTLAPKWLMGRTLSETERLLRARITREVGDFAGLVDIWDAINEVVIMPVFEAEDNAITPLCRAKGRLAMIRLAVDTARRADPHATLLLNDFDLSSAFECLIEGVLNAGIEIDAIGLQTHMHQGYRGDEAIAATLDRFARYGKPLHMTETSLVSGHLMPPQIVDLNDYQVDDWPSTPDGEARQADEIAGYYRTLLAQPAVTAVTYWGFTDRDSWLNAPTGLTRADGSHKPAYDALHDLIKGRWWVPPTSVTTDEAGQFDITAFKGDYEIIDPAGPGSGAFHLG